MCRSPAFRGDDDYKMANLLSSGVSRETTSSRPILGVSLWLLLVCSSSCCSSVSVSILVGLAMMPLVILAYRTHPIAALLLVLIVWFGAQLDVLALPAEPWSAREWFFNPFGWQLVFFTGFAFMSGWLPSPPRNKVLVICAAIVVLVIVPLAYYRITRQFPEVRAWRKEYNFLIAKTDFGVLRYVHFLAVAYLCWIAVGEAGKRILPPQTGGVLADIWRRLLAIIMKVGQQSLAVFITSMFTARLLGVALDVLGRDSLANQIFVNFIGFLTLVLVAYGVG